MIYNGFSHWKWWFSIAMLVYQRVIGHAISCNIMQYHAISCNIMQYHFSSNISNQNTMKWVRGHSDIVQKWGPGGSIGHHFMVLGMVSSRPKIDLGRLFPKTQVLMAGEHFVFPFLIGKVQFFGGHPQLSFLRSPFFVVTSQFLMVRSALAD